MNDPMPEHWAIVPAAGIGSRFGQESPKQYERINGRTILEHSVHPLLQIDTIKKIVIAISPDDHQAHQLPLLKDNRIEFVCGGKTRSESVLNSLNHIKATCNAHDWIIVHDAVRPCLSADELHRLINALHNTECGALLAVPVTDTLKKAHDNCVTSTIDRTNTWSAHTPQAFRFFILLRALQSSVNDANSITDESSAIEKLGHMPLLVRGQRSNIKITFPEDLELAKFYLSQLSSNSVDCIHKECE